jgi:PAS domain S-box-containing protein
MVQMGTWDWSLEADDVRWSENLYRIFGLEPGAITPSPEYVLEHAHPQDRVLVERQIDGARRTGQLQALDFRIVRPDGELRHVRTNQAIVGEAGRRPRRFVGSLQDITDRRRAERMIAAHVAVAEALAGWQTFEQGAAALLRNLAAALDCVTGVLWIPEGEALVARVVWHSDSTRLSELASMIPVLRPSPGVGLAGRAWETREPVTALSLEDDPRFGVEAVDPLCGALAVPARHGEEVLAVLELFCVEMGGADVTDRLVHSLAAIGRELGTFLGRRRGELKPSALTPRELEVLQLAAQGCAGREIAEHLVLSRSTVRTHFEHIYRKYGVSDRAAAVAKALREGLIE